MQSFQKKLKLEIVFLLLRRIRIQNPNLESELRIQNPNEDDRFKIGLPILRIQDRTSDSESDEIQNRTQHKLIKSINDL
uniref:Uncharacterized protein n=1 Tax=Acrobeloides nanus TaxID=290746 RepID=A0A914DT28_9BILA